MASSSAASTTTQMKYDVFLSFRGEDTRKGFTDHLYAALQQKGIFTFRDDERLEKGKEISSELLKAIEESRLSVIILSKNYASSTWCLDELAKIVESKIKEHKVVPVFYDVDPSEVRKQTGNFKKAFDKHEKDFREDNVKVQKWRSAITQVASLSGWHLKDRYESKFVKDIVEEISKRLNLALSYDGAEDHLVGIESRVKEINRYLEPGFDDVCFLGICGMGGIGKTTLARVLYDRLSVQYDGKSFLESVREASAKKKGLRLLQEQLLRDILMESNLNVLDVHRGIELIRTRLRCKRVFLVLDDVDKLEQLQKLAGKKEWFGSGSTIIITTRNEHLLTSHGVKNIYKVRGLNEIDALKLFHLKAFINGHPTNDYAAVSEHFVNYAQGLPLALEVLGSFLCGRSVMEWQSALERLRESPNKDILRSLRISYNGLDKRDQKIFLDIACFFKGKDKYQVMEKLDGCGFNSAIGISELIKKSLIAISYNKLWMHDLLQELGWEIVREQYPETPGKWSRLWFFKDINSVLSKNKGTDKVEGIILDQPKKGDIIDLNAKSFSTMSNLRLLKISNVHLSEDLQYLSDELRFLKWHEYPLKSLPSSFHPKKLFKLNMCYSQMKYLWKGGKCFTELKTIKLCHSLELVRTPDFSGIQNLQELNLEGCTKLRKVHKSVGVLKRLIVLNLKNCLSLVSFPSDVCGLQSLKILNLHGCSKLEKLPENLGKVENLEELDVSGTAVRQMPSYLVWLTNLRTLSFHGVKGQPPQTWSDFFLSLSMLKRNLNPIGLCSLKILDLGDCNLLEGSIPSDLGPLSSLQELNLSRNNFVSLPSFSQLSELQILCLEKCPRLQSLPELPPEIVFVGAEDCPSLETVSSLLELKNSPQIALHFLNCFQLVGTQSRTNSLAIKILKRWLQELTNHSQFHIRLPGSEIPKWFNHWQNDSSIRIRLPPHWLSDNFMGFAMCAVFAIPDFPDEISWDICCNLTVKRREFFFNFIVPSFTSIEYDHLWVGYLSRLRFSGPSEWLSTSTNIQASFKISGKGAKEWNTSVKRCGIRLIYKQDVEYLDVHDHHSFYKQDVEYLGVHDHHYFEESQVTGSSVKQNHNRRNLRDEFGHPLFSSKPIYMPSVLKRSSIRKFYDCV